MLQRDEVRSVLLAVLMLAAVGTAALPASAAVDSGNRSAPGSVAVGGTTTVTVTATMDGDGGAFSLTEEFSGDVAGASVRSVTVDGSSATPIIAQANENTAVVTLASTGPNAQVEVTYEIQAGENPGEITIDGKVDGGGTIQLGTDTITVGENNSPPTADAGSDRTATVGSTITLDGSASSDPDGDSLSYTWRRVSGPVIVAQGSGGPTTTAELQGTGTAVIELVVSDGVASDSDTVSIEITEDTTNTTTTTTSSTTTATTSTTTSASTTATTAPPSTTTTTTTIADTTTTSTTSTSTTTDSPETSTTTSTTEPAGAPTTATRTAAVSTADTTTNTESTTTTGDGPGFTAVLALVALVGAALLAMRRERE